MKRKFLVILLTIGLILSFNTYVVAVDQQDVETTSVLETYLADMFNGKKDEYAIYNHDSVDIADQFFEENCELVEDHNWKEVYKNVYEDILYMTRIKDEESQAQRTSEMTRASQVRHKACQFYVLAPSTNPPGFQKELLFTLEGDYIYNTQFNVIEEIDMNSLCITNWTADWGTLFNPAVYENEEFYGYVRDDGKSAVIGVRFWLVAQGNGIGFGQIDRSFTIAV